MKKDEATEIAKRQKEVADRFKAKLLQGKALKNWFKGLLVFILLLIFITLTYQTHNYFALVTESYQIRDELALQLTSKHIRNLPIFFRDADEATLAILDY